MIGPFIARMIFAVTVMVAALAFAPSAGMAHTGHDHGAVAAQTTTYVPSVSAVKETVPEPTVESAAATPRWIVGPVGFDSGNRNVICAGGCCSAASASCCALSLPMQSGIPSPPSGEVVFATVQCEGAGIIPGTLSEPPKFLV